MTNAKKGCLLLSGFLLKYPALCFGLTLYFSASCVHGHALSFLFFFLLALLLLFSKPKTGLAHLFCFFGFFSLFLLTHTFKVGTTGGIATFAVQEISDKTLLFDRHGWQLKGTLLDFRTYAGEKVASRIPCTLFVPKREGRPGGGFIYELEGDLTIKKCKGKIRAKPLGTWNKTKKTFRLTEKRYSAKKWVKKKIKSRIKNKEAGVFLSALVVGSLDDLVMRKNFSKMGLAHLLAISGFHFSLVVFCFYLTLRTFISPNQSAWLLLALITVYLIFIGKTYSIERAYVMSSLFLLSRILKRRYSSINALGAALFFIILKDPFAISDIGFQLSFLATGGILFLYNPCERLLEILLPKRSLRTLLELPLHERHILFLLTLFRKTLALSLSVTITLLPLTFYYFGSFPLISIFTNLFFPFLVSLSLFLLFLGFLIPFLGIHTLNSHYTSALLTFTEFPPLFLNKTLYFPSFPAWIIAPYLFLLFLSAILFKEYAEKKRAYGEFCWL